MVILVEGSDDVKAIRAILTTKNERLSKAIKNGTLTFDYLGAASALRQKASFYRAGACLVQCFLDNDQAAKMLLIARYLKRFWKFATSTCVLCLT